MYNDQDYMWKNVAYYRQVSIGTALFDLVYLPLGLGIQPGNLILCFPS